MATLNPTTQSLIDVQHTQFSFIGLQSTRTLDSLFEPIRQMNNLMEAYCAPMRKMQEALESVTEPIRIMQETIAKSPMVQMTAMVQDIVKSQRVIADALSVSVVFNFPKQTDFRLFSSDIIDGEIQEETRQTQAVVLPQPQTLVPVIPARLPSTRSILGLKEIAGRSFQYKRKTLQKLSYRNAEGRLLSLFLASRDLFVTDTDIYDTLHLPDGRSFSWVLRNLKRKFRENGLSAIIERRWDPDGYIFINIYYVH